MAHDEALARRLRDLLTGPGVTEQRMFGGVAFLLDGHLAVAASSRGGLMVRVDPDEAEQLLDQPGVEPVVMRGRPTRGWVHVQGPALDGDAALGEWVARGTAYAASLGPRHGGSRGAGRRPADRPAADR